MSNRLEIPSDKLIELVKQTVFVVSKTETRLVLTGLNFSFHKNSLKCVATDSHRLVSRELKFKPY
ncbi:hypothetical protein ACFQ3N_14935 [Virgibacillus byunsanensis]|uniref:DNA polymerase III beta sliding clamp central domain-containing protein n=1 Tax=Virgibacillus byunsanensis TaxID=570945 RepID=A0ABW3LPW8_9BACI